MNYCKDAFKLLRKKIICGKDCPIFEKCPRLILEDATDIAIERAISEMIEIVSREKSGENSIESKYTKRV